MSDFGFAKETTPGEGVREFYRKQGADRERERLFGMMLTNKILRIDALGYFVFVNCDTLQVEYLDNALIKGEQK
jgi:hypothetical protein